MKTNSINLKQLIIEKSISLGLDSLRTTNSTSLGIEFDNYIHWLENSYHGEMSYLERNLDKRKDINNILPQAKTIITVAFNYYTDRIHENLENSGKISRYAWGDDYHDVFLEKLKVLANYINEIEPESSQKAYVDTGSILEKQWAVRTGLGWQGKNSLILNRKLGSYFFIGIIITSIELENDMPIREYCGRCTACIDACPTNAIIQPKVVDSRKCISYWTIEAKPNYNIPEPISDNLNNWVFGCDICQEVCPWNRDLISTSEPAFQPRKNETSIDFKSINEMDKENFNIRFKNSPIKRTKLEGLIRNAKALVK